MKHINIIDRMTGEIHAMPMHKALAFFIRNRFDAFVLAHCGLHPLDITCSCYFMSKGKVDASVIRRIVEHKKHPERFYSDSIDYIGDDIYPF